MSTEAAERAPETADEEGVAENSDEELNLPDEGGDAQLLQSEKMNAFVSQFTAEQQSRYEAYRRSGFPRSAVKRLMQQVSGCSINQTMSIVMAGVTKVYVGELVEEARSAMDEWGETDGPIRPRHLREAYRRLSLKHKTPPSSSERRLFRR